MPSGMGRGLLPRHGLEEGGSPDLGAERDSAHDVRRLQRHLRKLLPEATAAILPGHTAAATRFKTQRRSCDWRRGACCLHGDRTRAPRTPASENQRARDAILVPDALSLGRHTARFPGAGTTRLTASGFPGNRDATPDEGRRPAHRGVCCCSGRCSLTHKNLS